MKRTLALATLLVSSLSVFAVAQTAAPAPAADAATQSKVAVIAFRAAVAQTNEGQRKIAEVQKKFEPKGLELKALSEELDGLKKKLQAESAKLTDADRNKLAKEIESKEKSLKRQSEDAQGQFGQDMQKVFEGLVNKVGEVMVDYATKNGYTVVLDIATQQQNPVRIPRSTSRRKS